MPLLPYIAEYNPHADFADFTEDSCLAEYNFHADIADFTEGCIVSLAAVSELSVHIPEANANGVMRYLRNLRNPRETRNSVIV